jgi:hypothetical protein
MSYPHKIAHSREGLMFDFIAKIKEKIKRNHNIDASYLSITAPWQTGIKVGDSYIFIDLHKSNQYAVRVFAPGDVPIKRLNSDGDIIEKNKINV